LEEFFAFDHQLKDDRKVAISSLAGDFGLYPNFQPKKLWISHYLAFQFICNPLCFLHEHECDEMEQQGSSSTSCVSLLFLSLILMSLMTRSMATQHLQIQDDDEDNERRRGRVGEDVEVKGSQLMFWISATNGSDGNPGSFEEPFLSLQRAQTEVRTIAASNPLQNVVVFLTPGTYYINNTITFTQLDSTLGGVT
jgi:hypothetical protein